MPDRRGIDAFLVQKLERICREAGNVPAARCAGDNIASRRTLERAGMIATGWIVAGSIRRP